MPDRLPAALRPYREAIVIISIAILMAGAFALSYSLALGRPTPHDVPIGVVGGSASSAALRTLERGTGRQLKVTVYADAAAGRRALEQQDVYGVLLLDAHPDRLLISSASGTSVSRVLESAAQTASPQIAVTDAHPLSSKDPNGLIAFYVTLAATIVGFVTMFQLRANAKGITTLGQWLVCVLGLALVGGLALALITDPLLDALTAPFGELWAALSAQIATAALFNSVMIALIGRWAIIPTWALFVLLGNASSGGAVAPPLLPLFYRVAGQIIPSGSTVEIIRSAVYFPSAQHLEPALVIAAWLVGAVALLFALHRWRGASPVG